jgi:DNA modification methylase
MMQEAFLDGKVVLHPGDCLEVLKTLDPNSVDAVVTDPPYHLTTGKKGGTGAASINLDSPYGRARIGTGNGSGGFMGKAWDGGDIAFRVELWAAVLRVLKPGGHIVAFSGTRTYHRMACAIEDAGFEIRDSIYWHYGSGFPKSHDVAKKLDASEKRCTCPAHMRGVPRDLDPEHPLSGGAEQDVQPGLQGKPDRSEQFRPQGDPGNSLRDLRQDGSPAAVVQGAERGNLLQHVLQKRDVHNEAASVRGKREGGAEAWQGAAGVEEPGVEGRCDVPQAAGQLREREVRPLPAGVSGDGQDGRLCDGAQAGDGQMDRPNAVADRVCPSQEPSTAGERADQPRALAGQPQPQKRGAWDRCRGCGKPIVPDGLGTALKPATEPICLARKPLIGTVAENVLKHGGRWPANVIHDGSDEVVGAFPDRRGAETCQQRSGKGEADPWRVRGGGSYEPRGDSGSAARFFYTAKADADDRLGSKHPTVKPLDLMQWLVRLVTPPGGGLVLDPFAGTGTTGEAAWREGLRAILIEREPEYQNDIRRRMAQRRARRARGTRDNRTREACAINPMVAARRPDVPQYVEDDRAERLNAARTLTSLMFGDPAPGQSALDKRRASTPSP